MDTDDSVVMARGKGWGEHGGEAGKAGRNEDSCVSLNNTNKAKTNKQWFLNCSVSGLVYTLKNYQEAQRTFMWVYIYLYLLYLTLKLRNLKTVLN